MQPAVSIIIPIYDVESYLEDCIDSVLAQTLTNIEIILIDDGSPDGCGARCDHYAAADSRVRVIHQTNQGLSAARNAGMAIATGTYLMFVDSDDWVSPDYCKAPYTLAQEHNAELVIFGYRRTGLGTSDYGKSTQITRRLTSSQALQMIVGGDTIAVWNKLYRRDLIENLTFPNGKVYEDTAFTPYVARRARRIWYLNQTLYFHRIRKDSITRSRTRKTVQDYMDMHTSLAKDLSKWGYDKEAMHTTWLLHWYYLTSEGRHTEHAHESVQILLNDPIPPTVSWKVKASIRLLRYAPPLFDAICFVFGMRVKA